MSAYRDYRDVGAAADIAQGEMRCFDVHGASVLVCHAKDGNYYAVDAVCSHAYARLEEGRLRGHRLICPLHGASFDVRDGRVLGAPAFQPIRSYPLRVNDGRIEIALDAVVPANATHPSFD